MRLAPQAGEQIVGLVTGKEGCEKVLARNVHERLFFWRMGCCWLTLAWVVVIWMALGMKMAVVRFSMSMTSAKSMTS